MRNISTFEPFIESIAQLITKLCIWTFFTQAHLEKFQGDENPLFTLEVSSENGDDPWSLEDPWMGRETSKPPAIHHQTPPPPEPIFARLP